MGREYIPPAAWFDIFLAREQSLFMIWKEQDGSTPQAPRMIWDWHEYGSYVGIPLALLFFTAVFKTRIGSQEKSVQYRHLALLICWLGFFILFVGDFAYINPYRILKQIPVFSSLHVTGRFVIILTFIASLVLMGFLRQLQAKYQGGRLLKYLIALACILIVGDVMWVSSKPLGEAFTIKPEVFQSVTENIPREDSPYQMIVDLPSYGSFSTMYAALTANFAILHGLTVQPQCYEPIHPRLGYELGKQLVFFTGSRSIHIQYPFYAKPNYVQSRGSI